MIERRHRERRSIIDRRAIANGRRIRHEMGCFTGDQCRRAHTSDRRESDRRSVYRRGED